MKLFEILVDSVLIQLRSGYINAFLFMEKGWVFIEKELSLFSGRIHENLNVPTTDSAIIETCINGYELNQATDSAIIESCINGYELNPTTGLPMMGGGMDIGGHSLGISSPNNF